MVAMASSKLKPKRSEMACTIRMTDLAGRCQSTTTCRTPWWPHSGLATYGKRNLKSNMDELQQQLESLLSGSDAEQTPEEVKNAIELMVQASIEDIKSSPGLEQYQQERREFEVRLIDTWRYPLNLLDTFIFLAIESGSDFRQREGSSSPEDPFLEALTRLHTKACQTSSEVLSLLRSGYADGAHARWRSLHEIVVVCAFISLSSAPSYRCRLRLHIVVVCAFIMKHGAETAKRYLLHDIIDRYKLARRLNEFAERLNEPPIPSAEFEALKTQRDELVDRFGSSGNEDYGWAAHALNKDRPSIADIEERVQPDHWRPHYRIASDNVHPSAHGTYYRLGLGQYPAGVLLAGPSNMGLADPGHATAVSLLQATVMLLGSGTATISSVVTSKVLMRLADEIGDAFLDVHTRLAEGGDSFHANPI